MIKISNDDNIVRYCKPLTLDGSGNPTSKSFESRPDEEYISVDWLEFFQESSIILKLKKMLIAYR
jgi:hypothetical protein